MKVFESVVEMNNGEFKKIVIAESCKQNAVKYITANGGEIVKIKDKTKDIFSCDIVEECNSLENFISTSYNEYESKLLVGLLKEFLEKRNKE